MEVYLLRHGIAVSRDKGSYPDEARPLTEAGRARMLAAAQGIRAILPSLNTILTSPYVRTVETAELVAECLRSPAPVRCDALRPGTDVSVLLGEVRRHSRKERVMMVGHESGLSNFAAALIGGGAAHLLMKKGGLCRIDIDFHAPESGGTLVWLLTPKLLRSFS